MEIQKPTPHNTQYPMFCGCGCATTEQYKKDCFFYCEEHQMGATIPYCSYHNNGLDYCPCNDCDKHISKNEVYKMVVEKVDKISSEKIKGTCSSCIHSTPYGKITVKCDFHNSVKELDDTCDMWHTGF